MEDKIVNMKATLMESGDFSSRNSINGAIKASGDCRTCSKDAKNNFSHGILVILMQEITLITLSKQHQDRLDFAQKLSNCNQL